MTDNRTNVQIVADALRSMPEAERDDDRDPAVVVAEYAVAALMAAGVAPQGPSRLPDFFAPKPMPNSYVPAPMLPSSGVDEDALAEAWERGHAAFEQAWESDHSFPYDYATDNPYRKGKNE